MITREQALEEFAVMFDKHGATVLVKALEERTGYKPSRNTLYDLRKGRGKDSVVFMIPAILKDFCEPEKNA